MSIQRRLSALVVLVISGTILAATQVAAFSLILDYTGFAWTNSGPASPQAFEAVGVINDFSAPVYDPGELYTYHLSGLELESEILHTPTIRTLNYAGGTLSVYRSTDAGNRWYDYGTNPSNPTSPSSFTDGVVWMAGGFSSFSVYYDESLMLGILDASGSFDSGEFSAAQGQDYFTFAGLTARPGSGIPEGYDYRMDGQLSLSVAPVPEPGTLLFLGLGLLGFGLTVRRRRR